MTILLQAEGVATEGTKGLFGGNGSMIIMLGLLFVVMYFFMIRPQRKQQKEQKNYRENLQNGQKIVTIGGLYGTIKEVKDTTVVIEISNNVSIQLEKAAIARNAAN